MNIPTELITLFGSSITGAFMRIWGASLDLRRIQHQMTLEALQVKGNLVHQARTHTSVGFQWTRRIIAITAVMSIIVLPKLTAIFFPECPIHIGYPEVSKGFLCFSSEASIVKWISLKGLVISPLDTHLLAAIIGLYFGGALIGKGN